MPGKGDGITIDFLQINKISVVNQANSATPFSPVRYGAPLA